MPDFLRWAGRVQYFLTRAVPRCRVALYYPLEEFQAAFVPDPRCTLNYTDAAQVENATRACLSPDLRRTDERAHPPRHRLRHRAAPPAG